MYAYFIPDKNEILEITISASKGQKNLNSAVINYLSSRFISKEMSISVISETKGVIAAQTKDNYLYIVMKDPDNTNSIFKKANLLVSDCAPENVWTIVRYYYVIATGAIVGSEVIGTFCALGKEIPLPTGSGGGAGSDSIEMSKAFIKSTCLDPAQSIKFSQAVSEYYGANCINKYIYKFNIDKGLAINLCMSATIAGNATYTPSTSTMLFQNDNTLDSRIFGEEFYHAFQNYIYPGGTSQYYGNADGNLEFEYQLQKDIDNGAEGTRFDDDQVNREYKAWLLEVTNGFTYKPTAIRELNPAGHPPYSYFVGKYSQKLGKNFSTTLRPLSLFHTSLNAPNNCN